ncbi:MAG TPA: DUF1990 family protein [Streptosporangiaceae bacterium]
MGGRLSPAGEAAALSGLRGRGLNYDPAAAPEDGRPAGHWHVDGGHIVVGREPAGPPVPGGPFELACQLVGQYAFTDGRIVRAAYRPADDLLGRDMLLEGRFWWLRFYLGVRVTGVTDETRPGGRGTERVWGWSYQTLRGHLEQGRLSYEVIKNLGSGQVRFAVFGYSRAAPVRSPVTRLGFALFGRRTQRRFYRSVQLRLRALVRAAQQGTPLPRPAVRADGIAVAPAGAAPGRLDRLARATLHPGR